MTQPKKANRKNDLTPIDRVLEHYSSENTKRNYRSHIYTFLDTIYGLDRHYEGFNNTTEELEDRKVKYARYAKRYVDECESNERDEDQRFRDIDDFLIIQKNKDKAYATVDAYLTSVRMFFRWNQIYLRHHNDWEKLRSSLKTMYDSTGSKTMDRAPTKREVAEILKFVNQEMKAAILMLVSSGMRINELTKIEIGDEDEFPSLHSNVTFTDPPTIFIPDKKSKSKGSPKMGRYEERGYFTFISKEAEEALRAWLDYKEDGWTPMVNRVEDEEERQDLIQTMKHSPRIFPVSKWNIRKQWNKALRKAGLDKKSHGRYILHIHTTRKFARSQWSQELKRDIWETYLGHKGYLDPAYKRYPIEKLRNFYKDAEDAITIGKGKERIEELQNTMEEERLSMKRSNLEILQTTADSLIATKMATDNEAAKEAIEQQIVSIRKKITKLTIRISELEGEAE